MSLFRQESFGHTREGERRGEYLRWGELVVEDADQPFGELRVGRDAFLDLLNQQWRRPRGTHLVSEPVHLPGVSITPAPPIEKRPIGGNLAAMGSLDHGRELDGLPEGISDALAGRRV